MNEREINKLFELNGFYIKRHNKHRVWSDGKNTITTSITPSDRYALNQRFRELKQTVEKSGRKFITGEKMEQREFKNGIDHIELKPTLIRRGNEVIEPKKQEVTMLTKKQFDDAALEKCKNWYAQKWNQIKITEALRSLGYVGVRGEPISATNVSKIMVANGLRYRVPFKKTSMKPTELKAIVQQSSANGYMDDLEEIMSSNLSRDMKEKIIKQWMPKY